MVDKKPTYVKQLKNWIVVISSITMAINLYLSKDFVAILLSSFTYISSQGLTFYGLNPKSDAGDDRRHRLINLAIAFTALIIVGLTIESKIEVNDLIMTGLFNIMKIVLSLFCMYVIYCSFADDSDSTTEGELELSKNTQKSLKKDYIKEQEKNIFSERNNRMEKNMKTRKFLLTKKKETEETK